MRGIVMISSTFRDLPEHRKKVIEVCHRLGIKVNVMEYSTAADKTTARKSLEMVALSASVHI